MIDPGSIEKLKARIQALLAKTVDNGCTQDEALAAAAKAAELLDRHDLSLSDVEMRESACERLVFETFRKKRIPIEDCVGAVAAFCDCRVWREKGADGAVRYVYFGLPADVQVAHYLTSLVDTAVRTELGRYKTSAAYRTVRHRDRHLANASFAFGMVVSIAEKLVAMKTGRDRANGSTGRGLVVLKASIVEEEMRKLDLTLRTSRSAGRMVAPDAFSAGGVAGSALVLTPGIKAGAGEGR